MTDAEVTVDRDAFPREIAVALTKLLERGLRRDAGERLDTADDMERTWKRIFEALDQPVEEQQPMQTRSSSAPEPPERPRSSLSASAPAL